MITIFMLTNFVYLHMVTLFPVLLMLDRLIAVLDKLIDVLAVRVSNACYCIQAYNGVCL